MAGVVDVHGMDALVEASEAPEGAPASGSDAAAAIARRVRATYESRIDETCSHSCAVREGDLLDVFRKLERQAAAHERMMASDAEEVIRTRTQMLAELEEMVAYEAVVTAAHD